MWSGGSTEIKSQELLDFIGAEHYPLNHLQFKAKPFSIKQLKNLVFYYYLIVQLKLQLIFNQ